MRTSSNRPTGDWRAPAFAAAFALAVGRAPAAETIPPPEPAAEVVAVSAPPAEGPYGGMSRDPAVTAVGAGGCATAACHGGPLAGNHEVHSFAARLWAERDPHAGAYATLHEPRSRAMAALLGIGPAHEARLCLACHSSQGEVESPLPPAVLADGVACGSCHGDATDWAAVHTLPEWKQLDHAARADLGYRDLADVSARVRTCIPCHVGDATREVDHDLIAAGHPRLAFEFAAYQRLWPRHWSPHGKAEAAVDFTERSWAVGQAETLAAVARLLAVRARRAGEGTTAEGRPGAADRAGRWPEFAEFDCYSCHRALSPERVAGAAAGPFANPAPGTPSWQPWSVAAARLLAATVDDAATRGVAAAAAETSAAVEPNWAAGTPDRLELAIARARALEVVAGEAARALAARDRVVLDAAARRLDTAVAADRPGWRTWEAAAQTYLLMDSALDGGPARLGPRPDVEPHADTRAALDALRASLRFAPGAGGPDGFDPARFERDRAGVR